MMLAEHITVLVNGVWVEGRRDADTENVRSFMCELSPSNFRLNHSRLAAVTCRFEDEGRTWCRGKLDSSAANALKTVMALLGEPTSTVCSECGSFLTKILDEWSCPNCGATYP